MDISQFAMNVIARNPNITNNPRAKYMVDVIQRGDANTGQQIAQNLCQTYGVSKEQALQQAMQFFGLH